MSDEYIFVYVTCENEEEAQEIASHLMEQRLVACANILPQHISMYEWEGKTVTGTETAMILKSRKELFTRIKTEIRAHHSYECPCIVAMDISAGYRSYLDWIDEQVAD